MTRILYRTFTSAPSVSTILSAARESAQNDGFNKWDVPAARSDAAAARIMTLFDAGAFMDPLICEEFNAFITYPLGNLSGFLIISAYKKVRSIGIVRFPERKQRLYFRSLILTIKKRARFAISGPF